METNLLIIELILNKKNFMIQTEHDEITLAQTGTWIKQNLFFSSAPSDTALAGFPVYI